MAEQLADVDLDALVAPTKRVKLGGKVWKLPGDMPMPLFLRIQHYEQRIEGGEDEGELLSELHGELLALFQRHQPQLKELPEIGVTTLLLALGAIYGGGRAEGNEPQTATGPSRKRTPSKPAAARAKRPARTSR